MTEETNTRDLQDCLCIAHRMLRRASAATELADSLREGHRGQPWRIQRSVGQVHRSIYVAHSLAADLVGSLAQLLPGPRRCPQRDERRDAQCTYPLGHHGGCRDEDAGVDV